MNSKLLTSRELKLISTEIDSLASKSEKRKKLFEIKRSGINLHELACAFLMGNEDYKNEKLGFYILQTMIKTQESIAEQVFCRFYGKGVSKNRGKAGDTFYESFSHKEVESIVLFDSPYSTPISFKSFIDGDDWKKGIEILERNREKREIKEYRKQQRIKYKNAFARGLYLAICGAIIVAFVLLSNHYFGSIGLKISSISLAILMFVGFKSLEYFKSPKNKFNIIALIIVLGILPLIPGVKVLTTILYPSLIILGLVQLIFWVRFWNEDYSNVDNSRYFAIGAVCCSFILLIGIVILTFIWGLIVFNNLAFFGF